MVTATKIDVGFKGIRSIKGLAPDHFDGSFYCGHNPLYSLKGAPSYIGGGFYCNYSHLKSLEGGPRKVEGEFSSFGNYLETLEGAPEYIGGSLNLHTNKLESLHNIHKHIKYIGESILLKDNPIKSHVLGLLLIDGLQGIVLGSDKYDSEKYEVEQILNKHLKNGRDVFACQEDLINAGFDEFAQL